MKVMYLEPSPRYTPSASRLVTAQPSGTMKRNGPTWFAVPVEGPADDTPSDPDETSGLGGVGWGEGISNGAFGFPPPKTSVTFFETSVIRSLVTGGGSFPPDTPVPDAVARGGVLGLVVLVPLCPKAALKPRNTLNHSDPWKVAQSCRACTVFLLWKKRSALAWSEPDSQDAKLVLQLSNELTRSARIPDVPRNQTRVNASPAERPVPFPQP